MLPWQVERWLLGLTNRLQLRNKCTNSASRARTLSRLNIHFVYWNFHGISTFKRNWAERWLVPCGWAHQSYVQQGIVGGRQTEGRNLEKNIIGGVKVRNLLDIWVIENWYRGRDNVSGLQIKFNDSWLWYSPQKNSTRIPLQFLCLRGRNNPTTDRLLLRFYNFHRWHEC
jgi:hypothetical protein